MPPTVCGFRRLTGLPTRTAILFAATGLVLTACGGDDPAAPSESDTSSATVAVDGGCATQSSADRDDVTPMPIPLPEVTVLEAGSEPRELLAGTPDRETAQDLTLSVTSTAISTTGSAAGDPGDTDNRSQTVDLPLTARFHCTDSTDVEMVLGTPTSPDAVLEEQLAAMNGTQAGLVLGPGTVPVSLQLMPPEAAGSEARHAVEQALVQALQQSIVLPTEPVGVGARWRTVRTINSAATVTQTVEATLVSRDGDRAVVEFTVDESPINSVFAIPGTAETLTIARYSSEGSGTVTVDLSRGLPVSGTTEITGARELVGADAAAPILQQTGLTIDWRSA